MLLYTHGPPAELVIANAFIPLLFAHQFQILSSTVVAPAKANYVKHNCLVRIWLIRRLQRSEQYLPFIASVQCGVTIGGDEQKNFRIEKADSV